MTAALTFHGAAGTVTGAALCAVIARELGWPHAAVAADGASPEL